MPTEYLTLQTRVQGAVQAAGEIGKVERAIDRVSTKAGALRGKLGGLAGAAGGFLQANRGYIQGFGYQVGAEVVGASNAGAGGSVNPAGVAGNVLGSAVTGAAFGGPLGAAAGIVSGIGKSAIEIGEATQKQSDSIVKAGEEFAEKASVAQLDTAIAGIDTAIQGFMDNPLSFFLGGGDAVKDLKALKDKYEEQKRVLQQEGGETQSAVRASGSSIVGAINNLPAPIVNVSVSANVSGAGGLSSPSVTYTSPSVSTAYSGAIYPQND